MFQCLEFDNPLDLLVGEGEFDLDFRIVRNRWHKPAPTDLNSYIYILFDRIHRIRYSIFRRNHDRSLLLDNPNGHKIPIFLEEAELPYTIIRLISAKANNFSQSFLQISPNNRIPAIVDREPIDWR